MHTTHAIDNSHYRLILKLGKQIQYITTARKSILELAENIALRSLQILYTFVLRAEIATIFGPNVVGMW